MIEFCFIEAVMIKASAYDLDGRRKYLNDSENAKFLTSAKKLRADEAAFCLTLYYTGCRISEALNLTREDIDSETNVIVLRTLKKRHKNHRRRLPIPKSLAKQLRGLNQEKGSVKIWSFSRTTGWRIVKKAMKSAGIIGIHATAKGLRHGFGVRGALNQIPLTLIRNWMGHADYSTTAIYLDVRDEEERELIERTW